MSALVALTAQNTVAVTDVFEVPPEFVVAQLDALFDDLGADAAKTGMLFSRALIETVADYLAAHPVPLVVDPVMVASSGARLLQKDAVASYVERLFPLATVVTPNLHEAEVLAGGPGPAGELAVRIHELGAPAVVVTGGHGVLRGDTFYDGRELVLVETERHDVRATHGSGCTHSATLAAHLARGESLLEAVRAAALAASDAVAHGLTELGAGEGPVDVLHVKGAR